MSNESQAGLIDVELVYENLLANIHLCAEMLKAVQPKASGSILLQADKCHKSNCNVCPHFKWKIWKGVNGRWSAYNIDEPLRHARQASFSPLAREIIRATKELLEAREMLTKQMAIVRRSAVFASRRVEKVKQAYGKVLQEGMTELKNKQGK